MKPQMHADERGSERQDPTGPRPALESRLSHDARLLPSACIRVHLRLHRLRLAALGCFALWLFLAAAPARAGEVYEDNVVIILDASGSMGSFMSGTRVRKMDAAKSALKSVLKSVPKSTQIALLVFSASNLRNDLAYPLGPRDDARLTAAIDLPEPGADTPLGRYIKKGADLLLAQRAKQMGYGSYRLLIVTDGEAQDRALVDRFAPEAMARGITVDVIGVDMRTNHTLATKVHSYRRADDPETLQRAVADIFAEISSTGSDAGDAAAFELVAALPAETARAAIEALATSGNQPLGEKPRAATAPAVAASGGGQSSSSAPVTGSAGAGTGTGQSGESGKKGSSTYIIWIVIGIVVVLSMLSKKRQGGKSQ